jgi:hypothetical protein
VSAAERLYPDLLGPMAAALDRSDPAADQVVLALAPLSPAERHARVEAALSGDDRDAPAALRSLVAEARSVPAWVDETELAQASAVFSRAGMLGGMALALSSLVYGYCAPAGNKPLVFSGRLKERADRRLAETSRFVTAVTAPRGLEPGAPGWRMVLKVRLMHAAVRKLVLDSGRWSTEAWSYPINQHDMVATILLFSVVFIDGVRHLGVQVTSEEADAYQHLFRLVGELIGVEPGLLPARYAEAKRVAQLIQLTQGSPDDDSRELVTALLGGPLRAAKTEAERKRARRLVGLNTGLCRSLIGDELADQLGLARDLNRHWAGGIRRVRSVVERARRGLPGVDLVLEALGDRFWRGTVAEGLRGVPAQYDMPARLLDGGRSAPVSGRGVEAVPASAGEADSASAGPARMGA